MSRLFKRNGSTFWYYQRGTPPNRVRRSTNTRNKKVAAMIQAKWDSESIMKKFHISQPDMKINELLVEYLGYGKSIKSESWYKRHEATLTRFGDLFGRWKISRIAVGDINLYIQNRLNSGRSQKTVKNEIQMISGMFCFAIHQAYMENNPCDGNMLPKRIIPVKPRGPIKREIIQFGLDNAYKREDQVFWTIIYYCGLRSGDAGEITPQMIVKNMLIRTQGKTGVLVGIPLHKKLKEFRDTGELFMVMPTLWKRQASQKRWRKLIRGRFGIDTDLHSLRHSFATHLAELGANMRYIKKALGHTLMRTSEIYTDPDMKYLTKFINQL